MLGILFYKQYEILGKKGIFSGEYEQGVPHFKTLGQFASYVELL